MRKPERNRMSFSWAKPYEPKHPFMRWFDERLPLPRIVYNATGPETFVTVPTALRN